MGLEQNLAYAKQAVAHVRNLLRKGSNTREDELKHPETHANSIDAIRGEVYEQVKSLPLGENGKPLPIHLFTLDAIALATHGFGYCGEQADNAFIYLKLMKVYPLDICVLPITTHQLVVIGRAKNSNPRDMSTWGNEAVVCDPWASRAYPLRAYTRMQEQSEIVPYASYFGKGMPEHYLTGKLISIYRDDNTPHESSETKKIGLS